MIDNPRLLIDLLPLVAQGIFSYASWPRWKTLVQKKFSDQHSIAYSFLIALGHCVMLTWVTLTQPTWAAIGSYCIAFFIALGTAFTVIYYRKFPGGRAPVSHNLKMPHEKVQ